MERRMVELKKCPRCRFSIHDRGWCGNCGYTPKPASKRFKFPLKI